MYTSQFFVTITRCFICIQLKSIETGTIVSSICVITTLLADMHITFVNICSEIIMKPLNCEYHIKLLANIPFHSLTYEMESIIIMALTYFFYIKYNPHSNLNSLLYS